MWKSDVICPKCSAGYRRIALASRKGRRASIGACSVITSLKFSTAHSKLPYASRSSPKRRSGDDVQAAGKRDFPRKVGIAKSAGGIRTTGEDPDRREGVYCFAALVVGRPFDLRDPLQFGSRWN